MLQKAAAAASPPSACARPAERWSSAATTSSGPGADWARCQARRSGSISGSVASAEPCGQLAVLPRRRPVGRRAQQRMPKPHVNAELAQAGRRRRRGRRGRFGRDRSRAARRRPAPAPACPPARCRRDQQPSPRRRRKLGQPPPEAFLDPDPTATEPYARHADTPRTLASNTKLFVTAAAAHRWGERVYPTLRGDPRAVEQRARGGAGRATGRREPPSRRAPRRALRGRRGRARAAAPRRRPGHGEPGHARQMLRFLVAMRHVRGYRGWKRALPVAGRSPPARSHRPTLSERAASYADWHHSVGRRDDPVREGEGVAGSSPAP
jgi:hypothetical protein